MLRKFITASFVASGLLLFGANAAAQTPYIDRADYGYYDCYGGAYDDVGFDDDWFFDSYAWDNECDYAGYYDYAYNEDYGDYDWDDDVFGWEDDDIF